MQQKLNDVKSVLWLEVTQINYRQQAGLGFTFHFYWFHFIVQKVESLSMITHSSFYILVKTLFMFCNWLETFILSFSFYQFDM